MKDFVWPVQYAEYDDIFKAWEVRYSATGAPVEQLLMRRKKNFFDEYTYWCVDAETKVWEKISYFQFRSELIDAREKRCYSLQLAMSQVRGNELSDMYPNYNEGDCVWSAFHIRDFRYEEIGILRVLKCGILEFAYPGSMEFQELTDHKQYKWTETTYLTTWESRGGHIEMLFTRCTCRCNGNPSFSEENRRCRSSGSLGLDEEAMERGYRWGFDD